MIKGRSCQTHCPFWLPTCNQACSLTSRGLYLPLPEHILRFCDTSSWRLCPRYVSQGDPLRPFQRSTQHVDKEGRRRHRRFSRHHQLFLVAAALDNQRREARARTIDLSAGGMRIETACALPQNSRITFTFAQGSPFLDCTGTAEIRWRRPAGHAGFQQYGLRFTDAANSLPLQEYLPPS
ncbi:MAG: hypothetical protein C0613_10860 [Desulfobulbaceae bacterium]|nr:MAG: hypothetical protein C0613_10860 [Desulfobulbaceae bacterium]